MYTAEVHIHITIVQGNLHSMLCVCITNVYDGAHDIITSKVLQWEHIQTAKEISPSHIYIHVGKGHTHMNTEATESEQTCKVYFHTYKFKIENVDTRSHTHCF